MSTVTIEEAQATLLDLIHKLQPDEEVVITENNRVAREVALPSPPTTEHAGPHSAVQAGE